MRGLVLSLALALGAALLPGCSAQPANVAAEVRREDGLYLVRSVHAQTDGYFMVSLLGKKADHRLSIQIRPRPNEPVPVAGETWKVTCNDAGYAHLVEVVKAGAP